MPTPGDITTYARLPRLQAGAEFVTFFVGQTVERAIIGDRRKERVKEIGFAAGAYVSPHIVDLKPAPTGAAPAKAGAQHDFEQKLAIWTDKARRAFVPSFRDEYRHIAQDRGFRAQTVQPAPSGAVPAKAGIFRTAPVQQMRALPTPPPRPVVKPAPVMIPVPVMKLTVAKPAVVRAVPPRAPREKMKLGFALPRNWHWHGLGFAAFALVAMIPIHFFATYAGLSGGAELVFAKTQDAIDSLKNAGGAVMARDGAAAAQEFASAEASFAATRSRLRGASVSLGALVTGKTAKLEAGKKLLSAGESLAKAGATISAAFESLEAAKDQPLTTRVQSLSAALAAALPDVEAAVAELEAVEADSVPREYRATFEAARADIASVTSDLKRFIASTDVIVRILGAEGKRRYLVVFQNDRELRPTGGFIGSFALMDVEDGEIMDMEVPAGGSYDMRGGLNERIAAPDQLRLVNPRWEFQDANWFADFPSSARSLSWFYEKSGGPTVDGVLAVTTGFMEDLLKTLGPIDMPDYGKTLTSSNFFLETQKAVELEYDKEENKPKQIISDLAAKVLERLVAEGGAQLMPLMDASSRALASKDIQAYFKDPEEQAVASELGWSGELKPVPNADFLSVVDSNIAGGKTDGVIHADIRHETEIAEDGSLVDTVSVTRTHKGVRGDLFTGIKNIDYIRFYVPVGSELLEAEGFEKPGDGYFMQGEMLKPSSLLSATEGEVRDGTGGTQISDESGLTVFGNWVQVEPGEKRTVRIRYRLPFKVTDLMNRPETRMDLVLQKVGAFVRTADLKLIVQKQAGARNRTFSTSITLPEGWRIRSRIPDQAGIGAGRLTLTVPLERDLYVGMLISNDR